MQHTFIDVKTHTHTQGECWVTATVLRYGVKLWSVYLMDSLAYPKKWVFTQTIRCSHTTKAYMHPIHRLYKKINVILITPQWWAAA